MALPDILKKIIADAEKEAKEIAQNNAKRVKEIAAHAKAEATELKKKSQEDTTRRKESMDHKVDSHLKMETKMAEAKLKTELLNTVMEKALEAIMKLPDADKVKMCAHMLKDISEQGKVHPPKGQEDIIKQAIQECGASFDMAEAVDIPAGFLFEGKRADVDANIETLLRNEMFPKVEREVSKILFSG